MATILFNDAVEQPDLLADFDPTVDILLFTEDTAAEVQVSTGTGSVTFTTAAGSATLDVDLKTITSGSNGFVRFLDGGALAIGDGTVATVADDLANNMTALSTDGADQIKGLGGNDSINGGEGADNIYGNTGNDQITGTADAGADTVWGGQGNDVIDYTASDDDFTGYGNLGNDAIDGSTGDDLLYGGQGADTINGGDGNDTVYGNADADEINGEGGSNLLFGGQGDDTIVTGTDLVSNTAYGNVGNDSIEAFDGGDVLFGGQGVDTLVGGAGDDELHGNADADLIINLTGGEDTVFGGSGNDTLSTNLAGSNNTEFADFNAAEDVLVIAGVSAAQIAGNAGVGISDSNSRGLLLNGPDIIIEGAGGEVTLSGAAGQALSGSNLILADGTVFVYNVGGAAASFNGGDFADFMIAGDNGDTLNAAGGANGDTLIGGDGNDLFAFGGNFTDLDKVEGGDGQDTLTATVDSATLVATTLVTVEQVNLTWGSGAGTAAFTINQATGVAVDASAFTSGQALDITVNSLGNVSIATGIGNDVLTTGVGADTLNAGDGDDTVDAGDGNDVVNGGAGMDSLTGGAGADTLTGGTGADEFVFSAGDSGFTTLTVDHITDFVGGEDSIVFSGGAAAVHDERLTDLSGSADLEAAAEAAHGAAAAVAGDAVLFVYGGRTYAFVNDAVNDGFDVNDDILIDITGFTGTIVAGDFA